MEDRKSLWLSWFIAIRTSRREDMRYYTSFSVGTVISIAAILSAFIIAAITPNISAFQLAIFLIIMIISLVLSIFVLRNFLNQYHLAENEAKDYSDAIEFLIMNYVLSNKSYQKLYYLICTRKYCRQTELGFYLSKTHHLTAGFGNFSKQRLNIIRKYKDKLKNLYDCISHPEIAMRNLK